MNAIDAIKRLERAGSENSRATAKLHEAARELAGVIERMVPLDVKLPRGYRVVRVVANIGVAEFLIREVPGTDDGYGYPDQQYIDGTGGYLFGDFNAKVPPQTRAGSLQFARDVAEGLIDEIAAWLEARAAKSDAAAATLEQAAARLAE